jgi:ubiquinone/menaquinone biosynthesis C-methylase UbiE
MLNEQEMITINKEGWNKVADQFSEGSFDVLEYGVYAPSEEELSLLGDIHNKVALEVGCGSGHTLEYLAKHGASELWGVDLSRQQIETAKQVVSNLHVPVHFIESPMEDIPGLPDHHFDIAISMYALGWTVNLSKTLSNIHRVLKPGGILVFCWEHPIYSLLEYIDGKLAFRRSYVEEGYEKHESWRSVPIVMNYRKLSTYINELIKAGFVIDHVVEETRIPDHDNSRPEKWYSAEKARIVPPSFTIKCHKR